MDPVGKLTIDELKARIKAGLVNYCCPTFVDLSCRPFEKRHNSHYFLHNTLEGKAKEPDIVYMCSLGLNIIPDNYFQPLTRGCNDEYFDIDGRGIYTAAWLGPEYVVAMTNHKKGNELHPFSPRNVLNLFESKISSENNVRVSASSYIDFYRFNTLNEVMLKTAPCINLEACTLNQNLDNSEGLQIDNDLKYLNRLTECLNGSGLGVSSLDAMSGPGQYRVNFKTTQSLLELCDKQTYTKQCIKRVSFDFKQGCTFMSKPLGEHPGSSLGVRIQLTDLKSGNNLFAPSEKPDCNFQLAPGVFANNKLKNFIGKILKHLDEVFILFAQTITSFKKINSDIENGNFHPTWGYEKRNCGINVTGVGEKLAVEFNLATSDSNPYLVYLTIVSLGLMGIDTRSECQPVGLFTHVSKSLLEAVEVFEKSEVAKTIVGEHFFDLMVKFWRGEWKLYEEEISKWEYMNCI